MNLSRLGLSTNFAGSVILDPLYQFARPSPATRIHRILGIVETVGPNVPRLEAGGLLIENAATNLSTEPVWSGQGGATATKNVTGPDALAGSGWTLDLSGAPLEQGVLYQVYGVAPNTDYTISFYAAADTPGEVFLSDPSGGGPAWPNTTTIEITQNWTRYSITGTTGSAQSHLGAWFRRKAGGLTSLRVALFQIESGSRATSYIPTTGAPATRAAETCVAELAAPWWNAQKWTLIIDALVSNTEEFQVMIDLASQNNVDNIGIYVSDGKLVFEMPEPNRDKVYFPIESGRVKVAATQHAGGRWKVSVNGSEPVDGGAARDDLGTFTKIVLGVNRWGAYRFTDPIRSLQLYPHALSDLSLQVSSETSSITPPPPAGREALLFAGGEEALWPDGDPINW